MVKSFVVQCDPTRALVTMKLSGFWTPDVVARFAPEWRANVRRVGGTSGYYCLCDLSDFQPQSREVTAAFEALLRDDELAAKRVALVTASVLTGLQVRRVSGHEKTQVFDDQQAALSWLEAQSAST